MAIPIAPAASAPPPASATPAANTPNTTPNAPGVKDAKAPLSPVEADLEVMVNGKPKKYTQAEAKRLLSKAGYADDAIRQAHEALKTTQQAKAKQDALLKEAKNAPDRFLKEHGVDPDAFVREYVERKIAESALSPEQKRIQELEMSQKQRDQELEQYRGKQREAQVQQQAQVLQQRLMSQLTEAMDRAGYERSPDAFYAIFEAVQEVAQHDLPWDPDVIVDVAKQRIDTGFQALEKAVLNGMSGDALLTRLGPNVVKEVLKARLAQVQGGTGIKPVAPAAPSPAPAKPSDYISPRDFRKKYSGGQ